jgi:hypothetical protein
MMGLWSGLDNEQTNPFQPVSKLIHRAFHFFASPNEMFTNLNSPYDMKSLRDLNQPCKGFPQGISADAGNRLWASKNAVQEE